MTAPSTFVNELWERDALATLSDYISIPARSPLFDEHWASNGHLDAACELLAEWARRRPIRGLTVEVLRIDGYTPVLLVDVAASNPELADATVVMYGHLDKQPEMLPWSAGLDPWTPVRRGDRLYGRGAGDDGYALFAALLALEANQSAGGSHSRVVVLIEASEESSSVHLPAYLERLDERLRNPDLVICLDAFCETYDRLWVATGIRGVVSGVLDIVVADDFPHSGRAGGVLPSATRVLRTLLDRVEDVETGIVHLASANPPIPDCRRAEARTAAATFPALATSFRAVPNLEPMHRSAGDQLIGGTWRAALEVIGADHLPPVATAGNVFRSRLAIKLSLRLPPNADVDTVSNELAHVLTDNPPFGASVTFASGTSGPGWNARPRSSWLDQAIQTASITHFGNPPAFCGIGGTIPFVGMLAERFPTAEFLVTGVLGPESNAHGPDEFLHVPTAKRITASIADVVNCHARSHLGHG
jgi:acetylornithine deacetylase/succinyl-diaminopimelate desuccinylase-like protein